MFSEKWNILKSREAALAKEIPVSIGIFDLNHDSLFEPKTVEDKRQDILRVS